MNVSIACGGFSPVTLHGMWLYLLKLMPDVMPASKRRSSPTSSGRYVSLVESSELPFKDLKGNWKWYNQKYMLLANQHPSFKQIGFLICDSHYHHYRLRTTIIINIVITVNS